MFNKKIKTEKKVVFSKINNEELKSITGGMELASTEEISTTTESTDAIRNIGKHGSQRDFNSSTI